MKNVMKNVAEEIVCIRITNKDTVDSLREKFFGIMRKYNIKQGTSLDGGGVISCDNYDWIMARTLFLDRVEKHIDWSFMIQETPKDLRY